MLLFCICPSLFILENIQEKKTKLGKRMPISITEMEPEAAVGHPRQYYTAA